MHDVFGINQGCQSNEHLIFASISLSLWFNCVVCNKKTLFATFKMNNGKKNTHTRSKWTCLICLICFDYNCPIYVKNEIECCFQLQIKVVSICWVWEVFLVVLDAEVCTYFAFLWVRFWTFSFCWDINTLRVLNRAV